MSTFETTNLDEARALCQSFYFPVNMEPVGRSDRFRYAVKVGTAGPVTVGEAWVDGEVRISSGDLVTGYSVNIPLSGVFDTEHRGRVVRAHPGLAAVYQPVGESRIQVWRADCRQLAVKIDRSALENHLQDLLDRPVRLPLSLGPSMDVSEGLGRSWVTFVRLLAAELEQPDSLVSAPMVSARLSESILAGLLLAADHPYRAELLRAAPPSQPRAVKRAIEAMEADPSYPFTTIEVARLARVSARALQAGFRQHTGMAPMAYLRQLRLARAHEDLCRTDLPDVTVAEVAHRWGFLHLGRFAGAYRHRYGVAPSTTLRFGK